jgi:RecB family endonuclease NucS
MKVLRSPTIEVTVEVVQDAIKKGALIILVGSVQVNYHGRASSKLSVGERVVILKPDGALLVHRPNGHSPVNWQPPGSRFEIRLSEDQIVLESIRVSPSERVKLLFDTVDALLTAKLKDEGEFSLYVDEMDIRDALLLEPNILEEGFRIVSREKRLPSGFVDLTGVDKNHCFTIVEIKKGVAGRDAVTQLKRYIDSIKGEGESNIRGILAATGLAKGCQELVEALKLEFKQISPKTCYTILQKHARTHDRQADLNVWLESD